MLSTQHTADIISKFETYLDDLTELSSQEELELANKIYQEICNDRPWMFLRNPGIGTISVGTDIYGSPQATIALPSDFRELAINNLSTDGTVSTDNGQAAKVVFVSCKNGVYTPYQVVNYNDRRQYLNTMGSCWIDPTISKIVFATVPNVTDLTYEFDYIKVPADLTAPVSAPYSDPIFPVRFWDIIYHLMAVDDQIIQLFDRAHSYMKENSDRANKIKLDMQYWDAQSYNN